jgi:hypothetical protein
MYRRFLIVIPLLTVFLSGCQLPGGKPSGAKEGYFTWVDEQGQVRQTVIPGNKTSTEDEMSPIRSDQQPGGSEASSGARHSEFNLENFPDGNALAERGYIRPGDPEPYFSWRDAQGNVRVSYYQPDTRTAVEKGEIKPPLKLTEASIYQATSTAPEDSSLPEGADPFAAAVLGFDDSEAPFFERWTRACCTTLDRSDHIDWEAGREFGVDVNEASTTHDFITGNSHYRLVRLPKNPEIRQPSQKKNSPRVDDFVLRLRAFDQKGLFVPSVAFLNDEFEPLRLVTDLVAEFVPESWRQHGYLRSYIPVFPSRGERWLLIYTTSDDRGAQTVIDTRYGPRAIEHQPTGKLGLVKVEE